MAWISHPWQVYFKAANVISVRAAMRMNRLVHFAILWKRRGESKAELIKDGWRYCIIARVLHPSFPIRRYVLGWIEHYMQEKFRTATNLERTWEPYYEPAPVLGINGSAMNSASGKGYAYCCYKPLDWTPTYKQDAPKRS
jgi:hypothetical protein